MHACAVGSTCAAPLNGRWIGAPRYRSIDRSCVGCGLARRRVCEGSSVSLRGSRSSRSCIARRVRWTTLGSSYGSCKRAATALPLALCCSRPSRVRAGPGRAGPGRASALPSQTRGRPAAPAVRCALAGSAVWLQCSLALALALALPSVRWLPPVASAVRLAAAERFDGLGTLVWPNHN